MLAALGDASGAAERRRDYEKYRVDDNARDRAIAIARSRDPAANRAADAVVIYELRVETSPPAPTAAPAP